MACSRGVLWWRWFCQLSRIRYTCIDLLRTQFVGNSFLVFFFIFRALILVSTIAHALRLANAVLHDSVLFLRDRSHSYFPLRFQGAAVSSIEFLLLEWYSQFSKCKNLISKLRFSTINNIFNLISTLSAYDREKLLTFFYFTWKLWTSRLIYRDRKVIAIPSNTKQVNADIRRDGKDESCENVETFKVI